MDRLAGREEKFCPACGRVLLINPTGQRFCCPACGTISFAKPSSIPPALVRPGIDLKSTDILAIGAGVAAAFLVKKFIEK